MANNATTVDSDDGSSTTSTHNANNGSSPITQNQFETLVHFLHNLSISRGNLSVVSNQVGHL